MSDTREPQPNALVAGARARLALRQQNLGVLLPVLLHDVNGALNGVTLSTELLARLPASQVAEASEGAAAGPLLQRTKAELTRLKQSLKALEQKVLPAPSGRPGVRSAALLATLQEVQALLLPAFRRGQQELQFEAGAAQDPAVALRADELFDLVAGLLIVALEGAAPHSTLRVTSQVDEDSAVLAVEHRGPAQAGIALEIHRGLLREAAAQAGGAVEWHQSGSGARTRLRLPLQAP